LVRAFSPTRLTAVFSLTLTLEVIGSALIGQTFTTDDYFWSRPSDVNYSSDAEANPTGVSGGSNLAPDNPELLARIQNEAQRLRSAGIEPTADLLYSSGSGLDPHISPPAAVRSS
jgi:K+-transporting ATPase ATPase C chain